MVSETEMRGTPVPIPTWAGVVRSAVLAVVASTAGFAALYLGLANLYSTDCQTYSGGAGSQTYYTNCGLTVNSGPLVFTLVGLFFLAAGVAEGWAASAKFEIQRFADRRVDRATS